MNLPRTANCYRIDHYQLQNDRRINGTVWRFNKIKKKEKKRKTPRTDNCKTLQILLSEGSTDYLVGLLAPGSPAFTLKLLLKLIRLQYMKYTPVG